MPTLQDISRAAGVSVKTVSRAMRGEAYVAAETLARIQESAKRLGYRPNLAARGLKTGRKQEIVLVLWSIDSMGEAAEIYMAKIRALDQRLREEGLPLTIRVEAAEKHAGSLPEKLLVDLEVERPLGVALLPTKGITLQRVAKRLEAAGIATIVLDATEGGEFDNVLVNRERGITEAIAYLHEIGRRRIAYVGPDNAENRLQGYNEGIASVGLSPIYHYLPHVGKSESLFLLGRSAAKNILNLSEHPDALIAYSDPVALGLLEAFKEQGVEVPGAIAIVGFDDKSAAVLATPRLTTIAHPNHEIGTAAAEILLKKLNGAPAPDAGWSTSIPARLVIRESA